MEDSRLRNVASIPDPRDLQDILILGWVTRKEAKVRLAAGIRSLVKSFKCRGCASALRIEQKEMAKTKKNLLQRHKLESREYDKATAMDP